MKFLKIIIFLGVFGIMSIHAQDEDNPYYIGIGINAIDFYPVNTSDLKAIGAGGSWYDEFFNAEDHYNIIPSLSTISVGKYLKNGFSLQGTGALNLIKNIGSLEVEELSYFGLDLSLKYSFKHIFDLGESIEPYATIGGGYTSMDSNGTATFNTGFGLNYWFDDNLGFSVAALYKHSVDNAAIYSHFQHTFGFALKFGGVDTDVDGIYDKDDLCPDEFGLEALGGCPDADGDGIVDSEDSCPQIAGKLEGCPDSDGDGITDEEDACPELPGGKADNGCPYPDSDKDGVFDYEDKCINEPGPMDNNGCPWSDADTDGIPDKDDNCPNVSGKLIFNGCNEIPEGTVATLESYISRIYFEENKSDLNEQFMDVIRVISNIILEYPEINIIVEGHTDQMEKNEFHQELSENRAKSVEEYLVAQGVKTTRIETIGYGKSQPLNVATSDEARKANRRFDIKWVVD